MNTCAFCGATMIETDKLDECSHPEGQGGAAGTLGVRAMQTQATEPRIRFNWGFWDGYASEHGLPDWWSTRDSHFDQVYVKGFEAGHESSSYYTIHSSDEAWETYQALAYCECGHRIMYHSSTTGRTGCHQCSCRKTHKAKL